MNVVAVIETDQARKVKILVKMMPDATDLTARTKHAVKTTKKREAVEDVVTKDPALAEKRATAAVEEAIIAGVEMVMAGDCSSINLSIMGSRNPSTFPDPV